MHNAHACAYTHVPNAHTHTRASMHRRTVRRHVFDRVRQLYCPSIMGKQIQHTHLQLLVCWGKQIQYTHLQLLVCWGKQVQYTHLQLLVCWGKQIQYTHVQLLVCWGKQVQYTHLQLLVCWGKQIQYTHVQLLVCWGKQVQYTHLQLLVFGGQIEYTCIPSSGRSSMEFNNCSRALRSCSFRVRPSSYFIEHIN
jgi:hypothetical protein